MLLVDELRDAMREEPAQHRLALTTIVVIGVALRLLYVSQPMRSEEAHAYVAFMREPIPKAITAYADPGNHALYTLLAQTSAALFGPAPWALRLPALLAGIIVVPASYAVVRALYGGRAAILATALIAPSAILVLYSTTARGYAVVAACFLLLVLAGLRLLRQESRGGWATVIVLAALGLATMPSMMFPLGSVVLWLALSAATDERKPDVRRLVSMLLVLAVITVLFIAPILGRSGGGELQVIAAPGSDWLAFFVELSLSIGALAMSWSLGLPPVLAAPLLFCVLVALRRHAQLSARRIGLPLATFVFCAWLLVVTHRTPLPRTWLWLVPLVLALASAGLIAVLEQRPAPRRMVTQNAGLFAMGVALVCTLFVTFSSAVLLSAETGAYRDAARATDALKPALRSGDLVIAGYQADAILQYYFDRKGVDRSHLAPLPSQARRVFLVVDAGTGQTLDGMLVPREVRDTARFTPPALAITLPSSRIYLLERRDDERR